MTWRPLYVVVLAAALGVSAASSVHAESWIKPSNEPEAEMISEPAIQEPYRYTTMDTEVAIASLASPRTECIVLHEVRSKDPYAIGSQGEQGIAQLHPRGLLLDFYRQGYSDPFNPYESVQYVNQALDRGMARNWSVVLNGSC